MRMTNTDDIAEVLGRSGNHSLVQLPGRGFPALAIQGDSLKCLQDAVRELAEAVAAGDGEEISYPLREVVERVAAMVVSFEEMSALANRQLPYFTGPAEGP